MLEADLDGVELDLQQTKDGVLVLFHDFLVQGVPVHLLTLAELRARVPGLATLEEALALLERYPKARVNLELKSIPGLEDQRATRLAALLATWPQRERVLVSSFDPLALVDLKEALPELPVGLLYLGRDRAPLALRLGLDAALPEVGLLTPAYVEGLKTRGLLVGTWPVASNEALARALAAGPDLAIGEASLLLKAKQELGHGEVDQEPRDVAHGGDQGV